MGQEYTFGQGSAGGTGVFSHEPKGAAAVFREQILLGYTERSAADVRRVIDDLKPRFLARDYSLLYRNCNTFADSLAKALLGTGIPGWVRARAPPSLRRHR
jgi:hypothetical protein